MACIVPPPPAAKVSRADVPVALRVIKHRKSGAKRERRRCSDVPSALVQIRHLPPLEMRADEHVRGDVAQRHGDNHLVTIEPPGEEGFWPEADVGFERRRESADAVQR